MNPQYITETTKSPAQAVTDLQAAVKQLTIIEASK